jgi:hypothetical protein
MNDDGDAVALSGHFTIAPRLKATDEMMLALHICEVEQHSAPCPWRVAGCGTVVVAREAIATSDSYDAWISIINRWLLAGGYELGSFVRFRGRDPGDEGVITYDGRIVLIRL